MNAKQYLVPSVSLQIESRVFSLFQVVGSCTREVRAAEWVLQSTLLWLLFLVAFVSKNLSLCILKVCSPLVESHWSKLHFAQQRVQPPSKQQNFSQYQTIQMGQCRLLTTRKPACSQTGFIIIQGNWDVLTSHEIHGLLQHAGYSRDPWRPKLSTEIFSHLDSCLENSQERSRMEALFLKEVRHPALAWGKAPHSTRKTSLESFLALGAWGRLARRIRPVLSGVTYSHSPWPNDCSRPSCLLCRLKHPLNMPHKSLPWSAKCLITQSVTPNWSAVLQSG